MRLVVLALLAVLAACPDRTIATVDETPHTVLTKIIPTSTDVDILFVIDDSASTKNKQQLFASNFTRFVQALDAFPGGRPNVHIGVVSTSVDPGLSIPWDSVPPSCPHPSPEDGRLLAAAHVTGCTPPSGNWIEDVATTGGARQTNYTGALDQELACIATIGDTGCGFEAPLTAIERALDGTHAENAGFLRPGAYLAVIVLTDEDDCSLADPSLLTLPVATYGASDFRCQPWASYDCDQPISPNAPGSYTNCKPHVGGYLQSTQHFHDFVAGQKSSGQVVVAVLGGDVKTDISTGDVPEIGQALALQPSCTAMIDGTTQIGRPGIRLGDFVSQFGDHGTYDSICQSDYSGSLTAIGHLLFDSVSPCLGAGVDPTDIDAKTPGVQLDCAVSDVTNINTPQETEVAIPQCPMTDATTPAAAPRPCWWIEPNPAACDAGTSGLVLHVARAGDPPAGDNIQVSCVSK